MLRANQILSINVQMAKMHGGSQSIDHWEAASFQEFRE
jgi:hypothetical protein